MKQCPLCGIEMVNMQLTDWAHGAQLHLRKAGYSRGVAVGCCVCRSCGHIEVFVPEENLPKLEKLLDRQ